MFRKRASRPKKNNISRTHGHRAHPRTKGNARRGGVGGRTGVRLRATPQGVKVARGVRGVRGVVRLARALMVLPTLRLAPTLYLPLCPLDLLYPLDLLGPLQALHSARSYFVAPFLFFHTSVIKQAYAVGIKKQKEDVFRHLLASFGLAEREGFEPPEPRSSTVFKTAAIDHSATSPRDKSTAKI